MSSEKFLHASIKSKELSKESEKSKKSSNRDNNNNNKDIIGYIEGIDSKPYCKYKFNFTDAIENMMEDLHVDAN